MMNLTQASGELRAAIDLPPKLGNARNNLGHQRCNNMGNTGSKWQADMDLLGFGATNFKSSVINHVYHAILPFEQ